MLVILSQKGAAQAHKFIITWKILKFCVSAESSGGLRTVGWYLDASGVASVSRWRAGYGDSLQ